MRRRCFSFGLVLTALCGGVSPWALSAALAQEPVAVRVGEHPGYSRLVIEWPEQVSYKLDKVDAGTLRISFNKAAAFDMADAKAGAGSNILSLSPGGDAAGAVMTVKVGDKTTYRDFMAGTRLIVDIRNPPGAPPRKVAEEAAPKAEAPKAAAAKPAAKSEAKPEAVKIPPSKMKAPQAEARPAPEVAKPEIAAPVKVAPQPPATPLPEAPPPADALRLDAHVIAYTATETSGAAAFVRNGNLWIVLDHASENVAPELVGPQSKLFAPFRKVELKGGAAYITKLPENSALNLYGEGGGLVWRVVLTPNRRDVTPVAPERLAASDDPAEGGRIVYPLQGAAHVLEARDPDIGDRIEIVTVPSARQFTGAAQSFVDFAALRAPVGAAFVPRADDLAVKITGNGVEISRPGGLAISSARDVAARHMSEDMNKKPLPLPATQAGAAGMRRIYDFDRWTMGGIRALRDNQHILMSTLGGKSVNDRVQDLLTLAKINVANDRGEEALGFLDFAESEIPAVADSPEFLALRGAADALSGKYESAFNDFFNPSLKNFGELDYWRAFTLSGLEDWKQAQDMMPKDFTVLLSYPQPLLVKLAPAMAEIALHGGDSKTADALLGVIEKSRSSLAPAAAAELDYLEGESARQKKQYETALAKWQPLVKGKDDLYRAKAGLAITLMQVDTKKMDLDAAIDRLEGLRFAWRGDELEARINFTLGKLYLKKGRHLKGFEILRDAASMSPDSDIGREITSYMSNAFTDLLMNDKTLSPLDAVTIYEEFQELTPGGEEGDRLGQRLAERLVEADLLDRAARLLSHQVDFRLQGGEKARVALRLGVIQLLNKNPKAAIEALEKSYDIYNASLSGTERQIKLREIGILHARALSQLNRPEAALDELGKLDPGPDVNRLRADIAWQAGKWQDAADALQDLLADEIADSSKPLTPAQADLILNRAVALNLAGNRVALMNIRERYGAAMRKTERARLFDVVTRPRKTSLLADRATIEGLVNEVDLFQDFLEGYRKRGLAE
jgi:tetratricopeptide (TPR) repeat protein